MSPSAWGSEHRLPQPLSLLPVWSCVTAHSQAWKGWTPWTRLVSTEEAPTGGLAGPADSGVRSEHANHAPACHRQAGPGSCAHRGKSGSWAESG